MKKKIIGITSAGLGLMAVIILGTTIFYPGNNSISKAEEVNQKLEEFNLELETSVDKYGDLKYSSNPYDFKVLDSYQQIVAYGTEAVPILEEKALSDEVGGLKGHLYAMAIMDILDIEKEDAAADNDGSAEDIIKKTVNFIDDAPKQIARELDGSDSISKKLKKIKKYGKLTLPFLKKIKENKNASSYGEKVSYHFTDSDRVTISNSMEDKALVEEDVELIESEISEMN